MKTGKMTVDAQRIITRCLLTNQRYPTKARAILRSSFPDIDGGTALDILAGRLSYTCEGPDLIIHGPLEPSHTEGEFRRPGYSTIKCYANEHTMSFNEARRSLTLKNATKYLKTYPDNAAQVLAFLIAAGYIA